MERIDSRITKLKIKKLLHEEGSGLSAKVIADRLGLNHTNTEKHLQSMLKSCDLYFSSENRRYYVNHRISHPLLEKEASVGNIVYRFSLVENLFGIFLKISEVVVSNAQSEVRSSILVPKPTSRFFVRELIEFTNTFGDENDEKENLYIRS